MAETITQCAILMAGKGTRFLPATKAVAKELFPIFDKPTLLYNLLEIYHSGIRRVALVISKDKENVKSFLTHNKQLEDWLEKQGKSHYLDTLNELIDNIEFSYIYQGEMNGSGGAVYALKEWAHKKPFAVFNGDDLCLNDEKPVIGQIIAAYEKNPMTYTAVMPRPIEDVPKYSCVKVSQELSPRCYKISALIEKPKNPPTNLVSLARYILTDEIFDELEKTSAVGGEVRLTDAINTLAQKGKVAVYEFEGEYYDCGNKLEFMKCCLHFALQDEEIKAPLLEYIKSLV